MNANYVSCPKCKAYLLQGAFNTQLLQPCTSCGTLLRIELFPAFFRPPPPTQSGEAVMVAGEASCFYHPQKKAVLPCESCGRFLCALCDVELNGQHLCPSCLESGKRKGKLKSLQNQRTLNDSIALALAVIPLLVWPFTIVTAPAAVYYSIRHWNTPTSLIPRTKWRFVVALLFGSAQIIAWSIGLYYAFRSK